MSEIFPFERSCTLFFHSFHYRFSVVNVKYISLDNKENTSYNLTQFLATNLVFSSKCSYQCEIKFSSRRVQFTQLRKVFIIHIPNSLFLVFINHIPNSLFLDVKARLCRIWWYLCFLRILFIIWISSTSLKTAVNIILDVSQLCIRVHWAPWSLRISPSNILCFFP